MDNLSTQTMFVFGGIGLVLLWIVISILLAIVRLLFGKKKKQVILTPEEQIETDRLRSLQDTCRKENVRLASIMSSCERANQQVSSKQKELENVRKEIDQEWKKLEEAKKSTAWSICQSCSAKVIGTICHNCGAKVKASVLPFVKVPWDDVNKYLYSIAEWGEPSECSYDADCIMVPWPSTSEIKFKVGGIEYQWGTMEDEDNGGNNWWAYLSFTHPIVGYINIINKVDADGNHLYRNNDDDDESLSGGNIEDLRQDIAKVIKQGLTSLYLWLKNEETPLTVASNASPTSEEQH